MHFKIIDAAPPANSRHRHREPTPFSFPQNPAGYNLCADYRLYEFPGQRVFIGCRAK